VALYPIALPLTIAAHLANALPDIETDRVSGRSSVVVSLGRRGTLWALSRAVVLPVGLVLVSLWFVSYEGIMLLATLVLYANLLATAWFFYATGGGKRSNDVWGFRFVVAASLVFATGWLIAVK
jgi:4-hydroxybenzoate polyprenyltransferase